MFFQSQCWALLCTWRAIPSRLNLPASQPPSSPRPKPFWHKLSWLQVSFYAGDSSAGHELEFCCPVPGWLAMAPPRLQEEQELGQCWEAAGRLPPPWVDQRTTLALHLDRHEAWGSSKVTWLQPTPPL